MKRMLPRTLAAALTMTVVLLTLHHPAHADDGSGRHLMTIVQALTDLVTLAYIFGSAVVFYGLAVLLTMGFSASRAFHPPNAARLGCWLGMLGWAAFVIFGLFGWLVPVLFFLWETIVVFSVILLIGILLVVTAKRAAR